MWLVGWIPLFEVSIAIEFIATKEGYEKCSSNMWFTGGILCTLFEVSIAIEFIATKEGYEKCSSNMWFTGGIRFSYKLFKQLQSLICTGMRKGY